MMISQKYIYDQRAVASIGDNILEGSFHLFHIYTYVIYTCTYVDSLYDHGLLLD